MGFHNFFRNFLTLKKVEPASQVFGKLVPGRIERAQTRTGGTFWPVIIQRPLEISKLR